MFAWNEASIERLKDLRREGLSFREIGKAMGCSRMAVCGAVSRYIHGYVRWTGGKKYVRVAGRPVGNPHRWTDNALTEPYAAFKARKQAERAAART